MVQRATFRWREQFFVGLCGCRLRVDSYHIIVWGIGLLCPQRTEYGGPGFPISHLSWHFPDYGLLLSVTNVSFIRQQRLFVTLLLNGMSIKLGLLSTITYRFKNETSRHVIVETSNWVNVISRQKLQFDFT